MNYFLKALNDQHFEQRLNMLLNKPNWKVKRISRVLKQFEAHPRLYAAVIEFDEQPLTQPIHH
jgi:hypothetical protein